MSDDEIIAALQARVADGRRANHVSGEAPACATSAHIGAAEKIIGFPLPPLLRRIYLEVANGGVGPFGGIEGLPPDGYTSDGDMLEGYDEWYTVELGPNEPPPPPRGVIFLCDFGCAMWAMLDCRHPQGQMWWRAEGEQDRYKVTLAEWLSGWLEDGRDVLDGAEIDADGESWHYPASYCDDEV
jgi:hypothetical protein